MPYSIPPIGAEQTPGFFEFAVAIRAAVIDLDERATALEGGSSFVGPFDGFASPHRAHSVRRLLSSYTGPLIKVRRSSDSTTLDIGYEADGDLDSAALLAFAGAGSAYVDTWYDQSGNARHLAQATTGQQPRIVNAGTLEVSNSLPAVFFDGSDDRLTSSGVGLYAATVATIAMVLDANSNAMSNGTLVTECTLASNSGIWRPVRASSANWNVQATNIAGTALWANTATGSNLFDLGQHQAFYVEASSAINTWKDNTAVHSAFAATRSGTLAPDVFGLGAHVGSTPANFYNGWVQELVTWATDRTADRAAIQTAQKSHFGTP